MPLDSRRSAVDRELAHLTRRLIEVLEALLPEPAYNYWIHTAPWQGAAELVLSLAPRNRHSLESPGGL